MRDWPGAALLWLLGWSGMFSEPGTSAKSDHGLCFRWYTIVPAGSIVPASATIDPAAGRSSEYPTNDTPAPSSRPPRSGPANGAAGITSSVTPHVDPENIAR